jgi:DNA-binding CsgD family transcriptional regulator
VLLIGRESERQIVAGMLNNAERGRSGALVVRGEAGIGKTALVDEARDQGASAGFNLIRIDGYESEHQLAFAGLHRLCAPIMDDADTLPPPQKAALEVALGQTGGPTPDHFLVGLATLTLLAESAEARPLLCLVDDAQWLDAASERVIAFVARRLSAERIAMMVAVREAPEHDSPAFAGIPSLMVRGLDDADSRALLQSTVRTPIDEAVRDRLVAEARGNPLALLELPRTAAATHLVSSLAVLDGVSAPRRVEEAYLQRASRLPADTQLMLLLAAADATADSTRLWAAAAHLGIPIDAAHPAEEAGLLDIDTQVRFRHPLARSAVYAAAAVDDRRRVHDALARVIDPDLDPDRQAWHCAKAVAGSDEGVAAKSVAAAHRALARGAMADAAALLARGTELTPDAGVRSERALLAAQALYEAGSSDEALRLLAVAESGPLGALQTARAGLCRAMISFELTHSGDAPEQMVAAAVALGTLDAAVSRETYLVALDSAIITGGAGGGMTVREVADAAADAPRPIGPPGPTDLLLDALVAAYSGGLAFAAPEVTRALTAFRDDAGGADEPERERTGRWLALAARIAGAAFDDNLALLLTRRNLNRVRESGSLAALPAALAALASSETLTGDLARGADLVAETAAISRAIGITTPPYGALFLAAWRGRAGDITHIGEIVRGVGDDDGAGASLAHYALAVSHNASGRYADAADAALRATRSSEFVTAGLALLELVEATSRAGLRAQASTAAEQLIARASVAPTPMARGFAAFARALVADDDVADGLYQEATEQLGVSRMAAYGSRVHLCHGEWLRRAGLRARARKQLRIAHETLADIGAEGFSERAARELRATGEHPRARGAAPASALTDHERHIARLVAAGATSREVAAELFLSPRTIEAHLRNIFRKVGIASRRELKSLRL